MVSVLSLLVPIPVSASSSSSPSSITHMVLRYHRNDFRPRAREDEVMAALRGFNIPPGDS